MIMRETNLIDGPAHAAKACVPAWETETATAICTLGVKQMLERVLKSQLRCRITGEEAGSEMCALAFEWNCCLRALHVSEATSEPDKCFFVFSIEGSLCQSSRYLLFCHFCSIF
mmetsp:Transcript_35126/g.139408  ORF Transcript_35126/g.139408 Transcript_35126/m.139408 type:complete len:114 (+) Transcript_35126:2898-3239(+)